MEISEVRQFFETFVQQTASQFLQLPQSGSERRNYVGTTSEKSYIITLNPNVEENESFLYLSELFHSLELNTPEIYHISPDRTLYIQEFLGKETLSEIIEKEGLSERVQQLVKKTLSQLHSLQQKTKDKIDFSKSFEYETYDELPITHDLYYFKNYMADILGVQYRKSGLLKEFKTLVSQIENLSPKGIMIRDFQSRNIIVDEKDSVYFIDYQSAMKGPLMYDVISFLYQAKANFPENFKEKMLDYYLSLHQNETEPLRDSIQPLKLIRFMQVLGAYGFRGIIQRKPHFLQSIGQGIQNLYEFSMQWEEMEHFPELKNVIRQLHSEEFQRRIKSS